MAPPSGMWGRHSRARCRGAAKLTSIVSRSENGYLTDIAKWMPLATTTSFAEAKAWCQEHPKEIESGYAPSKEALIIWTMNAAIEFAKHGVRLNCISPGPTDTPMMPAFEDFAGAQLIDMFARGAGRRSTPAEQAYPMIFRTSGAASYISGENLVTDGGSLGAMTTGALTFRMPGALTAGRLTIGVRPGRRPGWRRSGAVARWRCPA